MRDSSGETPETSALDDETLEEEDVFFRDVSEDLDDEERTSYAVLLILAVGGFALGLLLVGITLASAIALQDYMVKWDGYSLLRRCCCLVWLRSGSMRRLGCNGWERRLWVSRWRSTSCWRSALPRWIYEVFKGVITDGDGTLTDTKC